MHFLSSHTCKICGNAFWRGESLPRHQITCHTPFGSAHRPSATTVAITSQEIPACINLCWWSMELTTPPKYCMKVAWSSWYQLCHLLHHLQDKVQLQVEHEEWRLPAGTWNCGGWGRVCREVGGVSSFDIIVLWHNCPLIYQSFAVTLHLDNGPQPISVPE